MNNNELLLLRFLKLLAALRAIFRQTHIILESSERFGVITTNVIPFQQIEDSFENSDQETLGISISYALDAEIKQPSDIDHALIGASMKLWYFESKWKVEAEIGWSGSNIGWDPFYDKEMEADNTEQLFDELPAFTEAFLEYFKSFISREFGV